MKTRIYSPDIECDSCIKVIGKALDKEKGVDSFTITQQYVDILHKQTVTTKQLLAIIRGKGYRAFLQPKDKMGIRERLREFVGNKKKYAIEWRMLKYIGITLLILLAAQVAIASVFSTWNTFPWAIYLTISIVFIGAALWHFLAYKTQITCMTGMMIGMTIGMQTGMMIGAVIGVTNGFFAGATIGMLLGSIVGALSGKCCGIMGVMQGLMSGIMGGTMGAMITVMMYFEDFLPQIPDIHLFMPLYLLLNIAVLIGFSYMLFEELFEDKEVHVAPASYLTFFIAVALTTIVLTAFIYLAPSAVFLG